MGIKAGCNKHFPHLRSFVCSVLISLEPSIILSFGHAIHLDPASSVRWCLLVYYLSVKKCKERTQKWTHPCTANPLILNSHVSKPQNISVIAAIFDAPWWWRAQSEVHIKGGMRGSEWMYLRGNKHLICIIWKLIKVRVCVCAHVHSWEGAE